MEYERFIEDKLRDDIDIGVSINAEAQFFHEDCIFDRATEERAAKFAKHLDWYEMLIDAWLPDKSKARKVRADREYALAAMRIARLCLEHYRRVLQGSMPVGRQVFWFCPCPENACSHMPRNPE